MVGDCTVMGMKDCTPRRLTRKGGFGSCPTRQLEKLHLGIVVS
jgi:hypothetical protein